MSEEDGNKELLEQLRRIDVITQEEPIKNRWGRLWQSLKFRSALGHVGLFVSLSIYCAVGGIVSELFYCFSLPYHIKSYETQ